MDNPRLVIEFEDKSNNGGKGNQNVSNASGVSSSDQTQNFQNSITTNGIQTPEGQPFLVPETPPIQNPVVNPEPKTTGVAAVLQEIYRNDPNVSEKDVRDTLKGLGLKGSEIDELLDRAGKTNKDTGAALKPEPIPTYNTSGASQAVYGASRFGDDIDPATGISISKQLSAPPPPGLEWMTAGGRPNQSTGGNRFTDNVDPATGISPPSLPQETPTRNVVTSISNITSSLGLQNNPIGSIIQQATSVLPAVTPTMSPGVGAALSAVAVPALIAGAGIGIATTVYNAVDNEARRAVSLTGDIHPEVAVELALAEVRQIMANFRTANTLGDEAADYVRSTSRISSSLQGLRDTAAEPLIQALNENLEVIANLLDKITPIAESGIFKMLSTPLTEATIFTYLNLIFPGLGNLAFLARKANAWFDKEEDEKHDIRFIFDKDFEHLPVPYPFSTGLTERQPLEFELDANPGMQI